MRNLKDTSGLDAIRRDMESLCERIGGRLAGSPQEHEAARYAADRFRQLGLQNVVLLPFSCRRWLPGGGELIVLDGQPRAIPCQVVTHSVPTPEGGVEGDLAIFEPIDWERGLRRTDLAGKIGLFHGGYGESPEVFRQLHHSQLGALIFVDTRLQTPWPIANGMGEKFMTLLRKPMLYISLMDAWALARGGVERVRVTSRGQAVDATSRNVVGELPGGPDARIVVLSAHLDSVSTGQGADDDASGIAAILECARRLRELPRRRTLRFIAFGAEEQLSVGSDRYVTEQAKDLDRIDLACNFDSIAAWLGLSKVVATGTPGLEQYLKRIIEEQQQFGLVQSDVSPYQDDFPFCRCGIPGLWFTRETHLGTYWYHHSDHNSLENCSVEQIAWTAESASAILSDLAERDSWPFERTIAPPLREKLARYQRHLFGPGMNG